MQILAKVCQVTPMKLEPHMPENWFELLDDIEVDDALRAVVAVAKRQTFVAPSEIRAEVRVLRGRRAELAARAGGADAEAMLPAGRDGRPVDPDDVPAYLEAVRERRMAVGSGLRPRPALRAVESAVRALPTVVVHEHAERTREVLRSRRRQLPAGARPNVGFEVALADMDRMLTEQRARVAAVEAAVEGETTAT